MQVGEVRRFVFPFLQFLGPLAALYVEPTLRGPLFDPIQGLATLSPPGHRAYRRGTLLARAGNRQAKVPAPVCDRSTRGNRMSISPTKHPRIHLDPEAYQKLRRQVLRRDGWRGKTMA